MTGDCPPSMHISCAAAKPPSSGHQLRHHWIYRHRTRDSGPLTLCVRRHATKRVHARSQGRSGPHEECHRWRAAAIYGDPRTPLGSRVEGVNTVMAPQLSGSASASQSFSIDTRPANALAPRKTATSARRRPQLTSPPARRSCSCLRPRPSPRVRTPSLYGSLNIGEQISSMSST